MNKVKHKLLAQSFLLSALTIPSFGGDIAADLGNISSGDPTSEFCDAFVNMGK